MQDLVEGVLSEFAERSAWDYAATEHGGFSVVRRFRDTEPSPGVQWLRARGENFHDGGDRLFRASHEVIDLQRASDARYKRTPKGRARSDRYNATRRARRVAS